MPEYAIMLIQAGYENEHLLELASLSKPLKSEVDEIVCSALGISADQKITDYEIVELVINWFETEKIRLDMLGKYLEEVERRNMITWWEIQRLPSISSDIKDNGWNAGHWESIDYCVEEIKKKLSKTLGDGNKFKDYLRQDKNDPCIR
jgi:hypothetical protein